MASRIVVRSLLCLGAVGLAAAVAANGVVRVSDQLQPALALKVAPSDSRSLAQSAMNRLTTAEGSADYAAARAQATRSLQGSLVSADAIFVLLSANDFERRREAAARLAAVSDRISRRHLPTRLWLIETAVQAGSVARALENFDIALRTSTGASDILFPVLDGAMTDPALVEPIGALLNRQPAWASRFIYHVATTGQATVPMAGLLTRSGKVPAYAGTDLRTLLIARLIDQRHVAEAKPLAMLPAAASAQPVVDPRFTDARGYPPFTWALTDTVEMSAQRVGGGAAGLLVQADATANGTAAHQLLSLTPGRYRLTSARDGSGFSALQSPTWSIACNDAAQAPLVALPLTDTGTAAASFAVPAGCRYQWLSLALPSVDAIERREFTVGEVRITPAGG